MGRYKTYRSDKALSTAIDAYFNSISRTVAAKEMVYTGRNDKKGHPIYKPAAIMNDLGEPIKIREYIEPPGIVAMTLYIGISRQTWSNYCKREEFLDTTTRTRARVEAYLQKELDTRLKGTEGIKFDLMENFGWREKLDVTNHETVEEYLKNCGSKDAVADKSEF